MCILCGFNKNRDFSKSVADLPHLAIAVFKSPTRYLVVFAGVVISFIQIVQA